MNPRSRVRRKPQTVYVMLTFHGSYGDDVTVYRTQAARDAAVLAYLKERWPRIRMAFNDDRTLGDPPAPAACPKTIDEILPFYEDDCYGESDMRYDTFECEVQG